MDSPLISVIVPIYKVENYLRQCLDSIINQTYKNLEIILIDDGSPDNCPQICDDYAKKDNRIRVIHKENGGLSSARNAGLDVCKGEYISFVDSDDIISLYFIEILYKEAIKYDADICECEYVDFIDEPNSDSLNRVLNYKTCCKTGRDLEIKLLSNAYTQYVVVWNKLYKKNIYNELRFPNGKVHEDEFCTYKAFAKSNNVALVDQPLYYYRNRQNSITGSGFNNNRRYIIEAYKEKKIFYNNDKELYNMVISNYQGILKNYYFLAKNNSKQYKEMLKTIRYELRLNVSEYKKLQLSKKDITQSLLFSYFPNLYYRLAKLKDRFKNRV